MSTTSYTIKWLQDKLGVKFFPVTHIKAVRNDSDENLEDMLDAKQDTLVSGTNVKTINNNSIVGSGNVTIPTGDTNVIETVKVNGTALTPTNKAVDVSVPTESTVSGWGFTKNTGTYSKPSGGIPKTDLASAVQTSLGKADTALQSFTESDPVFSASAAADITSSDISNWNAKTSNVGTITGINMNGASKGTSGVVDLGTVITAHQDISGKADKSATVSTVTYDTTNKKLRKTINGTTTDIVTASTIVTDGGGIKTHQSVVLATGTNDGTMKITVNGSATDNVAVKGFSDLVDRVVTLEENSVFYKGHYLTSNSPFAKNSAVYFNGRMFVSNAQTSATPLPVYLNSSSNRLVLSDGGYIIASDTIDSTWEEKYE